MRRIRIPVLVGLCAFGLCAAAQQGGDLQAQILYAFYVEDTNALASLAQQLATQEQGGGADDTLRYHLAHAQYREGLLGARQKSRTADPAFAGCVNELKAVLEQQPDNVEALALQSACYANLSRLRTLEAVLLRTRADERIARAAELEPHNPRVELLHALQGLARARPGSMDGARATGELKLAAQAFELSSTTTVEAPGWGHAETYLELGRQLQAAGDLIGARNWIEKALIVAPDYKAAQRQLAGLVQR
jgi:tetratricopeptide (TPR) repeat protein